MTITIIATHYDALCIGDAMEHQQTAKIETDIRSCSWSDRKPEPALSAFKAFALINRKAQVFWACAACTSEFNDYKLALW